MEASWLPFDLLVEVLVRCDPRTVIRYGVACKLLWHNVADPAFHRRLRLRLRSADRFLLGLLYNRRISHYDRNARPAPLFLPTSKSFAGGSRALHRTVGSYMSSKLVDLYEPVTSRDGLVVLSREEFPFKLWVCHPVTGRHYFLPSKDIDGDLAYVLLPSEGGGGGGFDNLPFKLLVVDSCLRTQTISSAAGAWGPVTHTPTHIFPGLSKQVQPCPVVLGGVAHWLYRKRFTRDYFIIALDTATGQATWTEVPAECHRRRRHTVRATTEYKELLLVPSPADEGEAKKLGLLVSEFFAVSMWTLNTAASASGSDPEKTWVRHVVIDRATILRSVRPLSDPLVCHTIELEWVAEMSGIVVMQMHGVGIVLLNLRTLEVHQLERTRDVKSFYPFCMRDLDRTRDVKSYPFWLCELDRIRDLKSFETFPFCMYELDFFASIQMNIDSLL